MITLWIPFRLVNQCIYNDNAHCYILCFDGNNNTLKKKNENKVAHFLNTGGAVLK